MDSKILIGIGIICVLVAGVLGWMFLNSQSTQSVSMLIEGDMERFSAGSHVEAEKVFAYNDARSCESAKGKSILGSDYVNQSTVEFQINLQNKSYGEFAVFCVETNYGYISTQTGMDVEEILNRGRGDDDYAQKISFVSDTGETAFIMNLKNVSVLQG